ncbi:MAG: hypothetical protein IJ083_10960 [Clostridia bacterium]|nr:hypothetical protein [Clostridia bacterium]
MLCLLCSPLSVSAEPASEFTYLDDAAQSALFEEIQETVDLAVQEKALETHLIESDDLYTGVCLLLCQADSEQKHISVTGTMYRASQSMDRLTEDEFSSVQWIDATAVCLLENTDGSWNVMDVIFETDPYSEDTDLSAAPLPMQPYYSELYHYSIMIPDLLADSMIVTETGVQSTLPDGSATLFIQGERLNNRALSDFVQLISVMGPDAQVTAYPEENTVHAILQAEDHIYEWYVEISGDVAVFCQMSWSSSMDEILHPLCDAMFDSILFEQDAIG